MITIILLVVLNLTKKREKEQIKNREEVVLRIQKIRWENPTSSSPEWIIQNEPWNLHISTTQIIIVLISNMYISRGSISSYHHINVRKSKQTWFTQTDLAKDSCDDGAKGKNSVRLEYQSSHRMFNRTSPSLQSPEWSPYLLSPPSMIWLALGKISLRTRVCSMSYSLVAPFLRFADEQRIVCGTSIWEMSCIHMIIIIIRSRGDLK